MIFWAGIQHVDEVELVGFQDGIQHSTMGCGTLFLKDVTASTMWNL